MNRSLVSLAALPFTVALLLSGCASGAAPAATKKAGTELVVASAPTLRPLEYLDDNNKEAGFVIDLIGAAAAQAGYSVRYERMSFDALIPAVQSKRVGMVTQMGDLPKRRGVLTFIDFMRSGAALAVPDGNPQHIKGPEGLCGLEVAFAKGAAQQQITEDASKACVDAGKKPITMTPYPSGAEAIFALRSKQSDAAWSDVVNVNYVMKQTPGQIQTAYVSEGMGYGMGFPKQSVELREKFAKALDALRKDGTYEKLLDKYGLKALALDEFTVNRGEGLDAPSPTSAS
jgi:polar amino acid transport system substrate-binding protein